MIAYTLKLQKEIKLSESNKEMNPVFHYCRINYFTFFKGKGSITISKKEEKWTILDYYQ